MDDASDAVAELEGVYRDGIAECDDLAGEVAADDF